MNQADFEAQIAQLWIFPVKSCAGIRCDAARLLTTGLEWDRSWMVVDSEGLFLSQREAPRMALIRPQVLPAVLGGVLRLSAPDMPDIDVPLGADGPRQRVQVWDDTVSALGTSEAVDRWFSDFLEMPGLRLVRFDEAHQRPCSTKWSTKWSAGAKAHTHFADGYPVLVTTDTAIDELNNRLVKQGHATVGMERFRANVVLGGLPAHDEDAIAELQFLPSHDSVGGTNPPGEPMPRLNLVKPCARCPIPDIDPATAQPGTAVGDALQGYRQDARVGGAITFGMNAIVTAGAGGWLRVGQRLLGNYRFC